MSGLSATGRPRRGVVAFCLYDWANSAYATTTLAVVFQTYFVATVPRSGATIGSGTIAADTLWTLTYGLSVALVALAMPAVGAAADASGHRRAWLVPFWLVGCAGSAAMVLVAPGRYWLGAALLFASNVGFAGGNVIYNSFLPAVAGPRRLDQVSAWAYAAGYVGGGALLACHLGLIAGHERFGLTTEQATRLACGSVGLWWLLFGALAVGLLPRDTREGSRGTAVSIASALRSVLRTARELAGHGTRLRLLVAILLYQNGIQTVIVVAALFGQELLGMARESLVGSVLLIQALGVPGSYAMGWAAGRFGARRVLLGALLLWIALVGFAVVLLKTQAQFWVLAAGVGLVLGGSQALSRSLFASLIPEGRQGEFFGFYSIADKLGAMAGPLVYAAARELTGSIRLATLSVALFLLSGMVLLATVRDAATRRAQGGTIGRAADEEAEGHGRGT